MARTLIQNISGTPITLPLPYSVVLPPSGAVIVADTIPVVEGHLYVLPGMNYNLALSDVPEGNSVGGVPPVVSMGGQKLTGLGTPTAGTDAATKAYVDSTAGGTGTVTSIAAGNGLSASPGSPITTSGTLAVSFLGANAAGGSGLAGGNSTLNGGNGDGVGVGGNSTVQGGSGGATNASGGVATLQGGGGGGTNGSGGSAFVRGGQKQGSGTDGAVYVGDVFTSSVTVGATAKALYLNGIISSPFNIANDGASIQTLSNGTPGTTDIIALPTTPFKIVNVGAGSPLTLDATTPIANGTVNGQVFWLINEPDPANGTFSIPDSSNVIAEYAAGTLDFPPGTVAQFMWIGGFSKWLQIGKAFTVTN